MFIKLIKNIEFILIYKLEMEQVYENTFIPGETYIGVMNFDDWYVKNSLLKKPNLLIDRPEQYKLAIYPLMKATFLRYYTNDVGYLMGEWYDCKDYIPRDIYSKTSLHPLDIYDTSLLHQIPYNGIYICRIYLCGFNHYYFKQARFDQKNKYELQTRVKLHTRRQLQRALTGTVLCKDGIHSLYLPYDIIRLITTVYIDYSV
jgi:hypothetical protein